MMNVSNHSLSQVFGLGKFDASPPLKVGVQNFASLRWQEPLPSMV
jgi:hypothetical protein